MADQLELGGRVGLVLEMRSSFRYPVRAPVFFTWSDMKSQLRGGEGLTRDISSRGLFVLSADSPPAGMVVAVEVLLPRLDEGGYGLRIEGRGYVTRAEARRDDGPKTGFGFCMDNLILRSSDDTALTDEEEGGQGDL